MIITFGSDQALLFPFAPQAEYTETIGFLTDVLQSYAGEQRISLRTRPRCDMSQTVMAGSRQYAYIKGYMRKHGLSYWAVPLWHEATNVASVSVGDTEVLFDTSYADYRSGGLALIWASDYTFEAVTIDSVLSDRITLTSPVVYDYSRAVIMPIRKARTPNYSFDTDRNNGEYSDIDVQFYITDQVNLGAQAVDYTQYKDYQVMEDIPIRSESITNSVIRDQNVFDNNTGTIGIDPLRSQPFESFTASWDTGICGSARETLWRLRTWIHSMRGRAKSFWMPSYNNDLNVIEDIASADVDIRISAIDFDSNYDGAAEVMFLLRDGTRYYRSVVDADDDAHIIAENLDYIVTESGDPIVPEYSTPTVDSSALITIDSALGSDVSVSDIEMVSIMQLSRLDSDRIEVSHYSNGANISVAVVEVPVE